MPATYQCTNCGGWHGGVYGELCPECYGKENPDEDVEEDDDDDEG